MQHPIRFYDKPAGGLGSLNGTTKALRSNSVLPALKVLPQLNQPGGVDCPGCAYPDSPKDKSVDFCEQGAWAIAHETTRLRASPDFFAGHTLASLRTRAEWELEGFGRLTAPMLYDRASDTYREIGWDEAFKLAAGALRALDAPSRAVFYASGRSSNEAAFPYQLFARAFGTNNMPDSSNYCHESSGMALGTTLGVGKATITREDFEHADAIFVFGQNPATNHPRMLGDLREASLRGCRIAAFNPMLEPGLRGFADPQSPLETLTGRGTRIASEYFQVRVGGDLAAITGICKAVLEAEDAGGKVLDRDFIARHTSGFEDFAATVRAQDWQRIELDSGLPRAQIEKAAAMYMASKATIATWCMGLTQHEYAIETIQMLVNLMLLRGNVGRPGAGLMPVRGHSNVQGDRTVGVTNRPKKEWLEGLERVFGFKPPAQHGLDAVAAINGIIDGSVHAFLGLGGNFAVAGPDSPRVLAAMEGLQLTVHIATKLNRTHLHPGRVGLLLPCLSRTERDEQAGGRQFVSVEDTASMVHASAGRGDPASAKLRSEPHIVTELARHTLGESQLPWQAMGSDYAVTRELIEKVAQTAVAGFEQYNERITQPRGFHLPNSARLREWKTASGKAQFTAIALPRDTIMGRARAAFGDAVLCLATVRAHRQYNTTVYRDTTGEVDRYRGVHHTRKVLFISAATMARLGLSDGQKVDVHAASPDGIARQCSGYQLVQYDVPDGDVFGYFPELTPLISPQLVARGSLTPAFKEVPVLLKASE
ncbi:FdhF/YdeP family oxidoreductase [Pseudoduganella violaceinigra]|uniref:FdhF/YdeP family oxidoreductase n=1 Tax=Pseudoduganella violaceinigra TaxID=246602 RepID=UPI00040EB1BB|nr:FdhF/YdeP family oxidoreductase [Pseudoduganella violaceinigra]